MPSTDDKDKAFPESLYSKNMRAGYKTYYFDVREAKSGVKYLTMAETRMQDGQRIRTYFTIFPEQMDEFCLILDEMRAKIRE